MRQRFWATWDRFGGVVAIGIAAGVFLLGFVGISWYSDVNGLGMPFGTRLYVTASLFVLENGSLEGHIPWPLEIARWAAPLVLATTAIGTMVALLHHRTWSLRARRLRGHLVVIGLGERGWRAARGAKTAGRAVVAVDVDEANPHVRAARRLGIAVVVGNAAEVATLRAARLDRAARAIVFTGGYGATAEVADAVARFGAQDGREFRPEFCCYLSVPEETLARDLNALGHEQGVGLQREFFSLEERAGTVIVDRWAGLLTGTSGPVLVLGYTAVARAVIAAITTAAHPGPVEVTWIVPETGGHPEEFLAEQTHRHPGARLHLHRVPTLAARTPLAETLGEVSGPGLVVVAEPNAPAALSALATVDLVLRGHDAAIIAVTEGPTLVRMLRGHRRIEVFDIAAELSDDTQIARGTLERLARALHDGYLRQLNSDLDPLARAAKPAYRPWADLPEDLRAQNYDAARAIRGMLHELGLDVAPRTVLLPAVAALPDETVEELARAEHTRWFRSRHPGAPPPRWEAVDPVHAQQTRGQIRRLPATLAAADLQITPRSRSHGHHD